jgi:hypothetical protein
MPVYPLICGWISIAGDRKRGGSRGEGEEKEDIPPCLPTTRSIAMPETGTLLAVFIPLLLPSGKFRLFLKLTKEG